MLLFSCTKCKNRLNYIIMTRKFLIALRDNSKCIKVITLCLIVLMETVAIFTTAFGTHEVPPGQDQPPYSEIELNEEHEAEEEAIDHLKATELQRKEAEEKGLLILINKENPIDREHKPDDLTPIKYYASDRSKASRFMREEAAEHFHKLVEDAALEGYELVMTTAYRSYDFQEILWNNYVANEGEEAAARFSARPGQSEHQSGLAADVSSPSVNYALTESFESCEEGKWLAENAHRFGFIIRFPKGKESVTGYIYEPWHIRYVGIPIAKEIYSKEITLEEYLDK
jgi:D-alanyl-D-alanine carboxypeptidase